MAFRVKDQLQHYGSCPRQYTGLLTIASIRDCELALQVYDSPSGYKIISDRCSSIFCRYWELQFDINNKARKRHLFPIKELCEPSHECGIS